jgi:hypothetical protein
MQDSTEQAARRILEAVLRQLEGGAGRQLAEPAVNHTAAGGGSPLVVIMLGEPPPSRAESNAASQPAVASPALATQPGCGCQNNSPAARGNSLQSSHPGLERFDLPGETTLPNAPRNCYMEPDRVCVGSGACQMRGF